MEMTSENGEKYFACWTGDRDTGSPHKVTLGSYSVMKFAAKALSGILKKQAPSPTNPMGDYMT